MSYTDLVDTETQYPKAGFVIIGKNKNGTLKAFKPVRAFTHKWMYISTVREYCTVETFCHLILEDKNGRKYVLSGGRHGFRAIVPDCRDDRAHGKKRLTFYLVHPTVKKRRY